MAELSRFLACKRDTVLELAVSTDDKSAPKLVEEQVNPAGMRLSAITLSEDGSRVYGTGRGEADAEGNTGVLMSWKRSGPEEKLEPLGPALSTRGVTPCYIEKHPSLPLLAVANFRSPGDRNSSPGNVSVFRLDDTGKVLDEPSTVSFPGSGPNLPRQAASHPHCVGFTTSPDILRVADLGTDSFWSVPLNPQAENLLGTPSRFACDPGSGPRHFAVVENGHAILLVDEMANQLTWLKPTRALELEKILSLSMLPGPGARAAAADIQVSWDSRFVYTSLRGADEVVGYALDLTDLRLTEAVRHSSVGVGPRFLALNPEGHLIAVANTSGTAPRLDFLTRDPETGLLDRCDLKIPGVHLVAGVPF